MKRLALLLAVAAFAVTAVAVAPAHALGPSHRYQTGKNVRGLQWILQGHQLRRHGRGIGFKIRSYRHKVTGRYDRRTGQAVRNAKYVLGWPNTNGARAGALFTDVLTGKRVRPYPYRITAGKRAWTRTHRKPRPPPASAKMRTLLADAKYLIAHRSLVNYSQAVRMQIVRVPVRFNPPALTRYIYEDCSSSITGLYWLAGLPDPNGLGYNGYGYTGTMAAHGRVVWQRGQSLGLLRPGDLIFYGGGWPHHHVTMYLGGGRVFSHGTNTGPFNLPVLYRVDAVGAHRYVG